MNREKLLLAAGCAAFVTAIAAAQTPPAPAAGPLAPPYKNLQIFPKDITQQQLVGNMKFFTQSLGVRCSYCHVGEEGKPLSTYDFASDAKESKKTARRMLAMVHRINEQDFGVTNFKDVKVTCFTCHRGSTEPLTEPVNPLAPPGPPPPKASERG
jgi:cytochrome c peroxidase